MYLHDLFQKSAEFNGITRVRMKSGDTIEGKFVWPAADAMIEFDLTKGGRVYMVMNMIESVTLIDNLQLLEQKASEQSSL